MPKDRVDYIGEHFLNLIANSARRVIEIDRASRIPGYWVGRVIEDLSRPKHVGKTVRVSGHNLDFRYKRLGNK